MGVVKFPGYEPKDEPEVEGHDDDPIRLTPIELAKIEYASKKLNIPMDFPFQIVKWPWDANCTARDLGILVDENGEVEVVDDNLEMIRLDLKRVKFYTKVFNTLGFFAGLAVFFWLLGL